MVVCHDPGFRILIIYGDTKCLPTQMITFNTISNFLLGFQTKSCVVTDYYFVSCRGEQFVCNTSSSFEVLLK